ncbi:hypothetical protein PI124_g12420 [Phytophthora idaei]|nr:hypothetical protein PI124_g12420 [Phytophthora idaei]
MPRLLHVSIPLLQKLYMSKTNQEKALPEQNSIERIMHCMPVKSKQLNVKQQNAEKRLKVAQEQLELSLFTAQPTSNDPLATEYLMLKKQAVLKRLRLEASEEPSARAGSLITSRNTGTYTSSNTDIIDYSSNVTAQQAVDTSTHTLAVTSSEAESAAISESDITSSTVV